MKEFFYSFLLTYPMRLACQSEHRWYRAFVVRTASKNIVFSFLRMSESIGRLIPFPNFDTNILLNKLHPNDLSCLLMYILLSKSIILVHKDETQTGDILATLLYLLHPL